MAKIDFLNKPFSLIMEALTSRTPASYTVFNDVFSQLLANDNKILSMSRNYRLASSKNVSKILDSATLLDSNGKLRKGLVHINQGGANYSVIFLAGSNMYQTDLMTFGSSKNSKNCVCVVEFEMIGTILHIVAKNGPSVLYEEYYNTGDAHFVANIVVGAPYQASVDKNVFYPDTVLELYCIDYVEEPAYE